MMLQLSGISMLSCLFCIKLSIMYDVMIMITDESKMTLAQGALNTKDRYIGNINSKFLALKALNILKKESVKGFFGVFGV